MRVGPLLLVPILALAIFVQSRIDQRLGAYRSQEEILYLSSGQHIRRLAPGLDDLMADIYWLRTVQYFGGKRAFEPGKRFDLLEPLVNITVTLDPRFETAYRYGAIFLSEPAPTGAGNARGGISVLERGVAALPLSWQLRQDLAFCWFNFTDDAGRAAGILLEASRLPGAPPWFEGLAADMLHQRGDRQTSRQIWLRIYNEWEEGPMKWNAFIHLQRLDAFDAVDALSHLTERFQRQHGHWPRSLEELAVYGANVPLRDPTGVPFGYDPATGHVSIGTSSRLYRASDDVRFRPRKPTPVTGETTAAPAPAPSR